MLNKIFNDYFGESIPLEERNLNLGMLFFYGSFSAATVYGVMLKLGALFYLVTTLVVLLVTITYSYIIRYKRYNQGAFVIGILVNMIELPLTCYLDGRLISAAVIYFVLGFLFVIFNAEGKILWISVIMSGISYTLSMLGMYFLNYRDKPFDPSMVNITGDIIIPFAFCILYADRALIYKQKIHQREVDKAMTEGIRAGEMSRAKEVFLMNMSHEMRTPMNAIISATGLIEDKAVNNSVKQSIGYIQNACNALVSTIDDLLLFSKVENSRLELSNVEYDSRQLFEDIINMIAVRLMGTGVALFVHIDSKMPVVMFGDNAKLRQVFINILNNSVKYTTEGYVGLSVNVEKNEQDEEVNIHADIKDTGIGIKDEDIPRLFNAFERIDDRRPESRNTEGTGLGLSICKTILDTMGGTISVRSEYNKGSVFSFDVKQKIINSEPMARIKNPEAINVLIYDDDEMSSEMIRMALHENDVSTTCASYEGEFKELCNDDVYTHVLISVDNYAKVENLLEKCNKKIVILTDINRTDEIPHRADRLIRPVSILNLTDYFNNAKVEKKKEEMRGFTCPGATVMVIDDNRTNLFVAEGLLKRYGMNVVSVSSGKEALNLVSDLKFDLIFIDYMMPEMDGIDTLNAIRGNSQEWCKSVPCIVLTADAADGARQMLLNAGFDDYVSKPIKVDSLATTIYELINPELIVWNDTEEV